MDQVEQLFIKQQCTELVLQFALLNDSQQYEKLAELFAEDGAFYRPLKPGDGLFGRQKILEDLRRKPPHLSTFHVCTNILVTVKNATEANGITYFTVYLNSSAGDSSDEDQAFSGKIYVGRYEDEFKKLGQQWYFRSRRGRNNFHLKE